MPATQVASSPSFPGSGWELLLEVSAIAVLILTSIALVVVIVLVILRLPPLRAWVRRRARGHDVPIWLSWVAGTALHLDTFTATPEVGDPLAVAAVLSAQLGGAGVRRPLAGVDLATTPYRSTSVLENIAEAVKGLPKGQALAALLKLGQQLLPRDDLYLRGYLLESPHRGAGLVLNIVSDRGEMTSSGTLWADILEPCRPAPMPGEAGPAGAAEAEAARAGPAGAARAGPAGAATAEGGGAGAKGAEAVAGAAEGGGAAAGAGAATGAGAGAAAGAGADAAANAGGESKPTRDVLRLALAGAAWVQFQLLEEMGQATSRYVHTTNWRSASLFEVAVHDEHNRDARGLRALYALALDRDPANLPALFNLAVLELHAGSRAPACVRLRTVLAALTEGEAHPGGPDPLYYQAHYCLAAALQTQQLEAAPAAPPTTSRAELTGLCDVMGKLEQDIERTQALAQPPGARRARSAREIRARQDAAARLDTLVRIEGPFLVLIAMRRQSQLDPTFASIDDPASAALSTATFSRAEVTATLKAWGEGADSALNPQRLAFGHIASEAPEASYRTHYNRACYATLAAWALHDAPHPDDAQSRALDWAITELEYALEPGDLVTWAERDLALSYLKEQREDAFKEVLRRYTPGG